MLSEIWEHPPSMLINVDGRPLGSHGGSGPLLGAEGCIVNMHGYDRQRVILLTGSHFSTLGPAMADGP
jgi:hypothetical protein